MSTSKQTAIHTGLTAKQPHLSHTGKMLWQNKSVWIFDFDGTLVDSMTILRRQAGKVISKLYNINRERAEELYRQTSGLPFVKQIEQIYPGDERNALAVEAFESFKSSYNQWALPFPETLKVLTILKKQGRFIAVSSNNFQEVVERSVEKLGLPVDMVCGWHNGKGKGEYHFSLVREHTRADNSEMIFVGDSLHDAATARAQKLDFIGRSGTFEAAEFMDNYAGAPVIDSLAELL